MTPQAARSRLGRCGGPAGVPSAPRVSAARPRWASCSRRRDFLPAVPGWPPGRQTRRRGTRGHGKGGGGRGEERGRHPGAGRGRRPGWTPGWRGGVPGAGAGAVLQAPALRSSSRALAASVAGGGARPCPILPVRWGSAVRLHAECGGRTARRASVGAGAPRAPPGAPGPLAEAAPSGAL